MMVFKNDWIFGKSKIAEANYNLANQYPFWISALARRSTWSTTIHCIRYLLKQFLGGRGESCRRYKNEMGTSSSLVIFARWSHKICTIVNADMYSLVSQLHTQVAFSQLTVLNYFINQVRIFNEASFSDCLLNAGPGNKSACFARFRTAANKLVPAIFISLDQSELIF